MASLSFAIVIGYHLLQVGMERLAHRAGFARTLYDFATLVVVFLGKMEIEPYLGYPTRIGSHHLVYIHSRALQLYAHATCGQSHQSQHAAAECRGHHIGRRYGLALAVIVRRRIGKHLAARLYVCYLGTQVAKIGCAYYSHNRIFLKVIPVLRHKYNTIGSHYRRTIVRSQASAEQKA